MGTNESAGKGFGRRALHAVVLAAFGLAVAGLAPASTAEIVYKWRDARGTIHYTDRPPPPGAELLAIERQIVGRRGGEPVRQPQAARETAPAPGTAAPSALPPEQQARLRNQMQADVANVRAEQCRKAKERYDTYIRSRRLFREGPNKERIFLSDAELEEARLNAKREMDEACAAASAGR